MTVRLRGHHLLCVLTYRGEGYSPAFCSNLDGVVARIGAGEAIEVVEGPDDVCVPLLAAPDAHCRGDSAFGRDSQALASVSVLEGRTLGTGAVLVIDGARLAAYRAAFAGGVSRVACIGCEWTGLCSTIAAAGFEGTHLTAGAAGRP